MDHGKCSLTEACILIGHRMTFHLARGLKTSAVWRGNLSHYYHTAKLVLNYFVYGCPSISPFVSRNGRVGGKVHRGWWRFGAHRRQTGRYECCLQLKRWSLVSGVSRSVSCLCCSSRCAEQRRLCAEDGDVQESRCPEEMQGGGRGQWGGKRSVWWAELRPGFRSKQYRR